MIPKIEFVRRRTYLPHGDLLVSEEEDINLSGHLGGFLHVHIVIEEMLDRRDFAQWLELLKVSAFL